MPAIRTQSAPVWPKNLKAPASARGPVSNIKDAGERIGTLQTEIDQIMRVLREPVAAPDDFLVVDQDGKPVVRLGAWNEGTRRIRGIWSNEVYIGGNGGTTAPFWASNTGEVSIGLNGAVLLKDLDDATRGWLGVSEEPPLPVTGAVDNGAGLIRLTVVAHGYISRDTVSVANIGGVPAADGRWLITVIDANTLDLQGSVFSGLYTSGGTCSRYYAGILTEQIAIGKSFDDYNLRAFANGDLELHNASLRIETGDIIFTIDKTDFIKIQTLNPGDTWTAQLTNQGLAIDHNWAGIPYRMDLTPNGLVLQLNAQETSLVPSGLAISNAQVYLGMVNGPRLVLGPTCYISMEVGAERADLPEIHAPAYYAGVAAGIDKTITHLSAAPATVTLNYKDHSGTNQTAIVSAPITTATTSSSKGIITL